MRKGKKVISLALALAFSVSLMAGVVPSAAAYSLEPSGPHVTSIGRPPYNAASVDRAAAALALDVPYSAGSIMKAQYDADIAGGGVSFYMDRLLARTGSSTANGNSVPFTRGRALYMRGHTAATMGFVGEMAYMRQGGPTNLFTIASSVNVTETASSRVNAPGYYSNTFTGTNLTVDQKKFITENNVAVSLLTFNNSGANVRNITLTVSSNAASTAVGTTELRTTRKAPNVITDLTYRLAGAGFTVNGSNLVRTIAVPAGGSIDVSVVCGVTAAEIPESTQEFEAYLTMDNETAFKNQLAQYHAYWYKECPYVETASTPINKAVAYRWWLTRFNTLDANVPGYAFQYPVTIEGVLGYNNTIVLTQGMHMQDTTWLRTGTLVYGGLLNAGNLSYSSAYLDSQGTLTATTANSAASNWNQHYSNFIATAGLQAFKVHGGGKDLANTLAYQFAGDAQGQLDHFRADANTYLIGYNWNSMAGNDADAISFSYPKSGSWIERPESAYVYGAANAAAELYGLVGNSGKAAELQTLAGRISTDIQNMLWCSECGTFECAVRKPNTVTNKHNGNQLIRVKEGNLYDIYAEYAVPKTANGQNFVDGLRYLKYNEQYPLFPYYTSNQADRLIQSGGSNNFSNINFSVLVRAYLASLRYYDTEQQYVTSEMLDYILDWSAFNLYPAGNLDQPDNNEYFYTFRSPTDYGRSGIHHDTLGSYNWLMFEAMGGIVPRMDDIIELWPVELGYDHFLLNNVRYHDADLTIAWDKPGDGKTWFGNTYGEGFSLYINGEKKVTLNKLAHFTYNPKTNAVAFLDDTTSTAITFAAETGASLATAIDTKLYDQRAIDNLQLSGINQSSEAPNLALEATASASFTQIGVRSTPWNGNHATARTPSVTNHEPTASPAAANNGVTVNAPFWGNYGSANATDWLELDFGAPKKFDTVKLYFFNDLHDGGYNAPEKYRVEYFDGTTWQAVTNQNKTPARPQGNYNDVLFDAVTAAKVRVVVTNRPTYFTAISEMQVFDSGREVPTVFNTAPEVTLTGMASSLNPMMANLTATVVDDDLPVGGNITWTWSVTQKPNNAIVTFSNEGLTPSVTCSRAGNYTFRLTATDGVLSAFAEVNFVAGGSTVGDGDIAPAAAVAVSYCASWENANMVNNVNNNPSNRNPGTGRGWGNWSSGASTANPAWIRYQWNDPQEDINKVSILWYSDGGGTQVPTATGWKIQYSNDGTAWTDVVLTGTGTYANSLQNSTSSAIYNTLTFQPVTAKYLRIYVTAITANAAGTGVLRWKVYGNNMMYTDPVFVRTIEGAIPTLPAQVMAHFSSSSDTLVTPIWDEITADQVAEAQQDPIVVEGTVAGRVIKAHAYVYVRPDMPVTVNAITPVNITTSYGLMPALPTSVAVLYNDGAMDNQNVKVSWPVTPEMLLQEMTHEVEGVLTLPADVENTQKALLSLTVTRGAAELYVSDFEIEACQPMGLGETKQLNVTAVLPTTALNKGYVWSAGDASVATVTPEGLVTIVGYGEGTASFTITANDPVGFSETFVIALKGKVTDVKLNANSSVSLRKGKTLDLAELVLLTPADPFDASVTYRSSNPTVAQANSSGLVIGVKTGMAIITVTAAGGLTTQVLVTVTA